MSLKCISNIKHYTYRFGNIGPGSLGALKAPNRPKMGKIRVYLVVGTKFQVG